MPDYLEESLEIANRLLEQVRRLERELSGLEQQNAGQEEAPSADRLQNRSVSEKAEGVYNEKTVVNRDVEIGDDRISVREDGNPGGKRVANGTDGPAGEPELLRQTLFGGDNVPPRVDTLPAAEVDRPKVGAVLASQLEQMDRAAAVPPGGGKSGWDGAGRPGGGPVSPAGAPWRTVYPQAAEAPEGERAPVGVADGVRSNFGSDAGWAERTDQAFRRDSRRYDGGFYLY